MTDTVIAEACAVAAAIEAVQPWPDRCPDLAMQDM